MAVIAARTDPKHALPWAGFFQRRCKARREPRRGEWFFGRCELRRGHECDHALERGFYTPRWSTVTTGL